MGLKVRGWSFGLKISGLKCPAIVIQAGLEHLLENSVMIPKNQRKDSDFHISYINLGSVLLGSKSWKNAKFSNELNDNEKKNIDDYFYLTKKFVKLTFLKTWTQFNLCKYWWNWQVVHIGIINGNGFVENSQLYIE